MTNDPVFMRHSTNNWDQRMPRMTLITDGHYYENKLGRLYYQVHGPEDASAITFSYGVMMDHRTFDPQV